MIALIATAALTGLALAGFVLLAVVFSLLIGITLGVLTHASVRGY